VLVATPERVRVVEVRILRFECMRMLCHET